MIDLTPLDVRKKRGDFKRGLRGYDSQEVDTFLELAAERLEMLIKENLTLKERAELLGEQVATQNSREQAVQEALVTAQTLREEIQLQAGKDADTQREQARNEAEVTVAQARREALMLTDQANRETQALRDQVNAEVAQMREKAAGETELLRKETESELNRLTAELKQLQESRSTALDDMERKRKRFLRAFRSLLERELDGVALEEDRSAGEENVIELNLSGGQRIARSHLIETAALDALGAEEPIVEDGVAEEADVAEEAAGVPEYEAVEVVVEAGPVADVAAEHAVTEDVAVDDVEEVALVASPEALGEAEVEVSDAVFEAVSEDMAPGDMDLEAATHESILSETPSIPGTDEADGAGLESLVDRVLSEEDSSPVPADEVVPIGTLAPGAQDGTGDLDQTAHSAVSELFNKDVPLPDPEAATRGDEGGWEKLLRGEEDAAEDGSSAEKSAWAPNFPDSRDPKGEGSSGWSRRKGTSRWR